jgi:hypothetical protein
MRLLTTLSLSILFLGACSSDEQNLPQAPPAYSYDPVPIEDYWAKDNFDLQRAGQLLERSDSPERFERYINEPNGINNLDLNGDGYVDYISVDEFEDRDDHSRGLSLFTRFGADLVQEIATIYFYRDEPRYPGARVLLVGNDQLYGDNVYYETNWLDRSLSIASLLFSDRPTYYHSPYYFDNYPTWYQTYTVVETPIYRTRITELYPQPLFAYTTVAPVYFERVKIKSPNNGLHLGQIHAKLVKPTKEQEAFIKSNPSRRSFAKSDVKPGRVDPPRSDRGDERGNPAKDDRGAERGNPEKPAAQPKAERHDVKVSKPASPAKAPAGNPNKGGAPAKSSAPAKSGAPAKGGPPASTGQPAKSGPPAKGGNPNKGAGPGKGGGKKP